MALHLNLLDYLKSYSFNNQVDFDKIFKEKYSGRKIVASGYYKDWRNLSYTLGETKENGEDGMIKHRIKVRISDNSLPGHKLDISRFLIISEVEITGYCLNQFYFVYLFFFFPKKYI